MLTKMELLGIDITKYPYKVIRSKLGIINCRFYDLRGSYAAKSLRNGANFRDIADTLGLNNVETISSKVIKQIINKKDLNY